MTRALRGIQKFENHKCGVWGIQEETLLGLGLRFPVNYLLLKTDDGEKSHERGEFWEPLSSKGKVGTETI